MIEIGRKGRYRAYTAPASFSGAAWAILRVMRGILTLNRTGFLMLACFCLLLSAQAAHAADPAGKVTFLKGEAWVEQGLARRPLKSGSIVYAGDKIRTGKDANIYLRFLDKTFFVLGPEAKMNIDTYDESADAEDSFGTSILKGAFRFVSGLFAKKKPKSVKVNVTVATIGIRGTDVAGEVFEREEKDGVIVEASARVSLLEDEEGRKTAIEVSNAYGSVVIDEPGYGTEIADEHSPPSPVRRMQIRSVNTILRAIRNSTRSSTQKRKLP